MSDVLISVVIPAYNAGKSIRPCIESVLAQSYGNWQAVVVDDGSSDDTAGILDEYSVKDNRIKVIHQENGGPGGARNTGIDNSQGEYIVFVDSDDTISPEYFDRLRKYDADVVLIDVDRVDNAGAVLAEEHMSRYKELARDDFIRYQMTGKIPWGGVRKAVRRELLMEHNIRYSSNSVGEEAIYSFLVLRYAETVEFMQGTVYKYFIHPGSQSSSINEDPLRDVADQLKRELKGRELYDIYGDTVNAFFITAAIISLDRIAGRHNHKDFLYLGREKRRHYLDCIDANKRIDFRHLDNKAKAMYPFFISGFLTPVFCASRIKTFRK